MGIRIQECRGRPFVMSATQAAYRSQGINITFVPVFAIAGKKESTEWINGVASASQRSADPASGQVMAHDLCIFPSTSALQEKAAACLNH